MCMYSETEVIFVISETIDTMSREGIAFAVLKLIYMCVRVFFLQIYMHETVVGVLMIPVTV